MVSATEVARYLEADGPLGRLQLQKLLYYVQAWSLAWTGKPMFNDQIEAWANGPVVPMVFHSHVRGTPPPSFDPATVAVIDSVKAFYGTSTGRALRERTHREEPWIEARGSLPENVRGNTPISLATMRSFYTRQAVEGEEVPSAPQLSVSAVPDDQVQAEADRHRRRWRTLLDALA